MQHFYTYRRHYYQSTHNPSPKGGNIEDMEDKEIIELSVNRSENAISETDIKYKPLCFVTGFNPCFFLLMQKIMGPHKCEGP